MTNVFSIREITYVSMYKNNKMNNLCLQDLANLLEEYDAYHKSLENVFNALLRSFSHSINFSVYLTAILTFSFFELKLRIRTRKSRKPE